MSDAAQKIPRITFAIIVLNGQPFTKYCLRSIYPFAHQILIAEGASRFAAGNSSVDAHSTDGTVEALKQFKSDEDPENKVELIFQNGFWDEKDAQSRACFEKVTGDYVWQIDIDEFYHPQDIERVIEMLCSDPEISGISFPQISFWGGFDYWTDGWFLRKFDVRRIFRWAKGCRYVTHRPPTVLDGEGVDLAAKKWIPFDEMKRRRIFLYHYSLVFPKQVQEKAGYYDAVFAEHDVRQHRWRQESYDQMRRPYHVHNVQSALSWLERFTGQHPPAIEAMIRDINQGDLKVEMRRTDDIERLLASRKYRIGKKIAEFFGGVWYTGAWIGLKYVLKKIGFVRRTWDWMKHRAPNERRMRS